MGSCWDWWCAASTSVVSLSPSTALVPESSLCMCAATTDVLMSVVDSACVGSACVVSACVGVGSACIDSEIGWDSALGVGVVAVAPVVTADVGVAVGMAVGMAEVGPPSAPRVAVAVVVVVVVVVTAAQVGVGVGVVRVGVRNSIPDAMDATALADIGVVTLSSTIDPLGTVLRLTAVVVAVAAAAVEVVDDDGGLFADSPIDLMRWCDFFFRTALHYQGRGGREENIRSLSENNT